MQCAMHYHICLFWSSQLQVAQHAKVSPTEEVAELEKKREELDTEIARLETE